MELWEHYRDKAEQNLNASVVLVRGRCVSCSAFHAQQCIELSIKSIALKYGFEKFLKKGRFQYSHIPSRDLTAEIYDFVSESLKSVDKSLFDENTLAAIEQSISFLYKAKQFLKKIENNKHGEDFERVWLYSLGINQEEPILTAHDCYKKSFGMELSKQLGMGALNLSRKIMLELKNNARKNRRMYVFNSLTRRIQNDIVQYGFPDDIVDALLVKDEEIYNKLVKKLIASQKLVDIVDSLLSPNGLLSIIKREGLSSKNLEVFDINKKINFIWISYLVSISPMTVLLYPHVIIGRYPQIIDSMKKNSECIYLERKESVEQLIEETKKTFERVKRILAI